MNETPVSSNTRVSHRLERLIGSSYHQSYHQKKITSLALCVKRFHAHGQTSRYLRPVSQGTRYGRVDHQATTV